MNKKKDFIPEADPAVRWDKGKKIIIDNHVASKDDYWFSEINFQISRINNELRLTDTERFI